MSSPNGPTINSRQALESLIFDLLDDNDAVEWKNDSAYQFLQAMAAWLHEAERHYRDSGLVIDPNEPTWQLFADMLRGAAC